MPGIFSERDVALSDFQNLLDNLAKDDGGRLSVDDRDAAITLALHRYSKDRPRSVVEDVVAPGGRYLPLPAAWDAAASAVQAVEYPIGEDPAAYVNGSWLYHAPSETLIGVPVVIAAGAQVRVTYSTVHQLDNSVDTIPARDREAVVSYAAGILFDQLAALYSSDGDSTIQADTVNHGERSSRFASRANKLRQRYFDELGVDPKRQVAASVTVDLDMPNSLGHDRLTHPARYR